MVEIKARVTKGHSKAALDMIAEFCAACGHPPVPLHRGIFDEPDSHYALVWMKLPELNGSPKMFGEELYHLLDATFTSSITSFEMETQ